MSLEEKFEALMQNCQSIYESNRELENQNEYLRRQIGEALKQTKKAVKSPCILSMKMMAKQAATLRDLLFEIFKCGASLNVRERTKAFNQL